MKRTINYSFILVVLLAALSLLSCRRTEVDMQLSRTFMPSGDIKISSGQTSATISWVAALYTNKATYTVDLSQDSSFQTTAHRFTTDTASLVITDDYLVSRTKYYVRVRTNAKDSTKSSLWLTSNAFSITGEQLFLALSAADIIDKSVILRWQTTTALSKIVLKPASGAEVVVNLTDPESQAGKKQVDGLKASTTYTAEIFTSTGKSKGILTFTTKAGVPAGGLLVDLTGFTNRPSVLADTFPLIPAGSTIVLKRGETYVIGAELAIDKPVSFVSEISFSPVFPVIKFNSNLNLGANTSIDSIVFRELTLVGADYTASYIMNADKPCTVNKMIFETCKMEIFRGVLRIKSTVDGTTVNNVLMNNCIIDSIADYGVVNGSAAGAFLNVTIQNSTIYKAQKVIVGRKLSTSVLLSDCTFNEAPQGGGSSYLVDYSSSINVSNGIKLVSCILGPGRLNGASTAVRGIVAGGGTSVTSSNSFSTSDYSASANPIPGLTGYSGSSTTLFQAPAAGNFYLKDNNFTGKSTVGDPRWRQ